MLDLTRSRGRGLLGFVSRGTARPARKPHQEVGRFMHDGWTISVKATLPDTQGHMNAVADISRDDRAGYRIDAPETFISKASVIAVLVFRADRWIAIQQDLGARIPGSSL
jgi:hypothetical protein